MRRHAATDALLESQDFAEGTSSRSTKLIHGGVRYLAQGNIKLVREALHRARPAVANAPHLVHPTAVHRPQLSACCETRVLWRRASEMYDALAGARGIGRSDV